MEISRAKKLVELTKGDRKILVTFFEGDQVSSCVEEETKKYCETCQCDEGTCQEWIDHLKSQGYDATEVELGELGLEESLPRFLLGKMVDTMEKKAPATVPETAATPPAAVEEKPPVEPELKPEGEEKSAVSETDQALP